MLGVGALLALALAGQFAQDRPVISKDPNYFEKSHLGELGRAVFDKPDSVTVQRILMDMHGDERDFTISKMNLVAAGSEHELALESIYSLKSALDRQLFPNLTLCGFHPDHVVRFKKGDDTIEIVTCFKCYGMIISLNGERIGGTSLPRSQSVTELRGLIPLTDDFRAILDENFSIGFYDALQKAESASAQSIELDLTNLLEPIWTVRTDPKTLEKGLFEKMRTTMLTSLLVEDKSHGPYDPNSKVLSSSVVVTFDTDPPIQVVFPSRKLSACYVVWGEVRAHFLTGRFVRRFLLADLEKIASSKRLR